MVRAPARSEPLDFGYHFIRVLGDRLPSELGIRVAVVRVVISDERSISTQYHLSISWRVSAVATSGGVSMRSLLVGMMMKIV